MLPPLAGSKSLLVAPPLPPVRRGFACLTVPPTAGYLVDDLRLE